MKPYTSRPLDARAIAVALGSWICMGLIIVFTFLLVLLLSILSPLFLLYIWYTGTLKELPSFKNDVQNHVDKELMVLDYFVSKNKSVQYKILSGDCFTYEIPKSELTSNPLREDADNPMRKTRPCVVEHHTVVFSPTNKEVKCDKKILFVHGVLAHPATVIHAIPFLVEKGCEVYCTALPGYGIVKEPDYLWSLGSEECEQWLEFYGEWIKHVVLLLFPNEKPIIMGHSFGSNACSYFCYKNPDMFRKFIAMDHMCMLPTSHKVTSLIGIVFNHFPFYLLRYFGSILNIYLYTLCWDKSSDDRYFNLLEVSCVTLRHNYGKDVVTRFIDTQLFYATWRSPIMLPRLLPIGDKIVSMGHVGDKLACVHGFKVFFDIVQNENISMYAVSGNGHNPARDNYPEFVIAIRHILDNIDVKNTSRNPNIHSSEGALKSDVSSAFEAYGWMAYDTGFSAKNIKQQYLSLRSIYGYEETKFYTMKSGKLEEETDELCFGVYNCA